MRNAGYTRAQYFHCATHRLNLVLSSVATMDPFIKSFFDILDSVYSFLTGVKRCARFLAVQKEMYPTKQIVELVKASEHAGLSDHFRWSVFCAD